MHINIDDYSINYKISGSGEKTAVILQGWGTEMNMYDSIANALSDTYRVVQFDFPGFGGSDEPDEAWNVEKYSDFFIKFMNKLEIKEAVLIGHSYGGRVIIKLASKENLAFTISKIVLVDSAGIMPKKNFVQRMKIKRYKIKKAVLTNRYVHAMFPDVIDYWLSKQGSEDYRNASPIMKKCLVMAVNEDQMESLHLINQETLLVWGDLDDATPIEDAKVMEEKIPNSELVVFEGAGHYSFLEQPGKFRSVLRFFLSDDMAGGVIE